MFSYFKYFSFVLCGLIVAALYRDLIGNMIQTCTNIERSRDEKPFRMTQREFVVRCQDKERFRLLHSQCSVKSLDELAAKEWYALRMGILVDLKHKLVACVPPKSGCTTWKTILVNNSKTEPLSKNFRIGQVHDHKWLASQGVVPLGQFNASMQRHYLTDPTFFRFMVARHPFERLYSAYVDKFVPPPDPGFMFMYRQILKLFHPDLPEEQRREVTITFAEFIKYLKLPASNNVHWASVYNLCQPCAVKYDQVLKTETFDEDLDRVILNHLGPYYRGSGTWAHDMTGGSQGESRVAGGRLMKACKAIEQSDIDYLADRFHKDFDYFGYSFRMTDDGLFTSCAHGAFNNQCC